LPVKNKIDDDHKPWKFYYGKQDKLDATHSLAEIDGPFDMYNMAIEIPLDQMIPIMKLMKKESFDCADRFSVTGGIIQGEFEIWDGDYKKHLYFCVDFTLQQAIKFLKQTNPAIGFIPVGIPQMMIGAQQIFTIETIREILKIKMTLDADLNRPETWKVG